MADQGHGRSYYRDDEIVVDNQGLPHFTGEKPALLKEYKLRVKLAYNNLDGGDGDEAEFDAKLRRKQCSFANDLIKALHGKAFRQMQELLNESPAALRSPDGY